MASGVGVLGVVCCCNGRVPLILVVDTLVVVVWRCKGIITTKEVPYFINPKEVSFVVAVLSALAFLSRAEIGEIRVVGGIPFYLPSCSVWTKVGGCGSKEARSAGTHSSPPFGQRDWI